MQKLSSTEIALLIQKRLKNFWGYGNLKGPVWFIGMEEGLGENEGLPIERFQATDGKIIVDITDNTSPDHSKWFKPNAPTQRTWCLLIFILLYQKFRRVPTIKEIRAYQINQLGRTRTGHAILELMPLPAKSTKKADWIYQDVPLIGLTNREEYLATYLPDRVQALKLLIEKYQPKLVLFYSRTYFNDWQSIVPKKLKEVIPDKLHIAKVGNTIYAVTPHPTSRGLTTSNWTKITKIIIKKVRTTMLPKEELWQKVLEVESKPNLQITFLFDLFYLRYLNSNGMFSAEMLVLMLTSPNYREEINKLNEEFNR